MPTATAISATSGTSAAASQPDPDTLCLRARDGSPIAAGERWLAEPGPDEEAVLDLALGPVLDVGCGPGRHVMALARRGVMALGLDITPAAVSLARARGALVLQRSVFDRVPGRGRWGSALLLDGNAGIGGDPTTLLRRLASLLRPGGRVLLDLEARRPETAPDRTTVRLEQDGRPGPWFGWDPLTIDCLEPVASAAGLRVTTTWPSGGRWFGRLDRP